MGRDKVSLMRKAKAAHTSKTQHGVNAAFHEEANVHPCPGG